MAVERGTLGKGAVIEFIEDNIEESKAGYVSRVLQNWQKDYTDLELIKNSRLEEIYYYHQKDDLHYRLGFYGYDIMTRMLNLLAVKHREYLTWIETQS